MSLCLITFAVGCGLGGLFTLIGLYVYESWSMFR